MEDGKKRRDIIKPIVKAIGAVTKWFISKADFAALRVTDVNNGKSIPYFLAISDAKYNIVARPSIVKTKKTPKN